ncbi:MAG: 4Fe-4S binding protein [Planctomycetota bacterium]|jgi:polyferredoxin|nr:4Fe-4S binding protein [Planctomycetota bacterium]
MTPSRARFLVKHLSFAVLVYGGRLGINLGTSLPCFACPYVAGCGGHCYLMRLQGGYGLGMSWEALTGAWGRGALGGLAVFLLLAVGLGKAWCGWICPFGTLSDWLGTARRALGLEESRLFRPGGRRLGWVKYALLIWLVGLPPLVTAGILHPDFHLPFCNICPGKALLPLFAGDFRQLALNFASPVTLALSLALTALTGAVLAGMFFRDRFFCLFCPLLAIQNLLRPFALLRLAKAPELCLGCGNCARNCPMEVEGVRGRERSGRVSDPDCQTCFQCLEACPADGPLRAEFLGFTLLASSRRLAARWRERLFR